MKKILIKFIKIGIPFLIGLFFVVYAYQQFSEEQIEEIKSNFTNANYTFLVISIGIGFLSHLSRAYRWNFLLEPMGYKPKLLNNIMAIFIAYLMNVFIPRSGEVSRAVAIQKYENIPFDKAMGTIITERIIDFILLLLLIFLAFFIQFDIFKTYVLDKIDFSKLILYGVILMAVISVFILFIKKSSSKISVKIKSFLNGLKEGMFTLFKIKKKGAFIFHTILIWVLYLAMFYIASFAVEGTSNIGIGATITTFIVGGVAIAFTNGGFGSYPYLVAEMLILYNVPETSGTAFGWILWTAQFVMFVVSGSLSFALLPIINRKINPNY